MKENSVVPSPIHYFTAWEEMKSKPKKTTKCKCKTKDVLVLIFALVFIILSIVGLCFLIHYCFKPTEKPTKPSDDYGSDNSENDDSGSGTTTEPSPTGSKVMLIGGTVSGANKNDIEIIDLEDSSYNCPKSDNKDLKIFPDHNVHSPGGGLVRYGDGYMPFICGGETNSKGKSDLCYQLPNGETEFKLDDTAKMNTKRRSVAYSVLDDKLVIAGGDKGGRTDTIEVMKPNEAAVELNAKLPVKVQDFCAVPISDSSKISITISK